MTATWHTPKTWELNELVMETDLNEQVRDNLDYLFQRPSALQNVDKPSNYTTTSTSFVDVDTTDLSLAVDVESSVVEVHFHGSVGMSSSSSGYAVHFDVAVDGTPTAGNDGICVFDNEGGLAANGKLPISFTRRITGLSVGSHTFKLQWKVSAGTATLYAGAGTTRGDIHPQFWVKDVG